MSSSAGVLSEVDHGTGRIRALIVDQRVRPASLANMLERDRRVDVIATAKDMIVAVRAAVTQHPDLIVICWDAPNTGVLEAAWSLRRNSPTAKIIMLCRERDGHAARLAKGFGADALLFGDACQRECQSELARLFPA